MTAPLAVHVFMPAAQANVLHGIGIFENGAGGARRV